MTRGPTAPLSHPFRNGKSIKSSYVLELDFEPFNSSFPKLTQPRSIGNGVQFLNKYLSSRLFKDASCLFPLVDFLRLHNYNGETLLLNEGVQGVQNLQTALTKSAHILTKLEAETPFPDFHKK